MKRNLTRYRVGTFNVEYGRDPDKVKAEVTRALNKYDLDVLVVQEAADYYGVLHRLDGYNYFCNPAGDRSNKQVGILVKDSRTVDKVKYRAVGDGWRTVSGAWHGPVAMPSARIDKLFSVMGTHAPTPSKWVNGVLHAPPERKDDYGAVMDTCRRFMRWGRRMVIGDWNEPPTTIGVETPRDVAKATQSRLYYPPHTPAGHGTIDYGMARRMQCYRVIKDKELFEKSDHQLVVLYLGV